MKIAITGSEGFLGKSLIGILGEDFEIAKLDRKKSDLFHPESLKDFLEDTDVVIHLAGLNRDSDYNLFRTNFLGTVGLLEGIIKYSPKAKIIFASSFQIYNPNNAYAQSKKLAEEVIESFSRLYAIKSIILRISNIYGPNGRPFYNSVIATFDHLAKNDRKITINGTGDERRDYIYVSDVAKAIKKAIEYSTKFEKFDICSGETTSLNEITEILGRILSTNLFVERKNIPELEIKLKKNYQKAEKKLLWKPQVSLEEGLKRTFT